MTTAARTRELPWVTISDAAAMLGVNPRTLRRYIVEGRIKVERLSTQIVRVYLEDIKQFRKDNILIVTGTGGSYVPKPEPGARLVKRRRRDRTPKLVQAAAPAQYTAG